MQNKFFVTLEFENYFGWFILTSTEHKNQLIFFLLWLLSFWAFFFHNEKSFFSEWLSGFYTHFSPLSGPTSKKKKYVVFPIAAEYYVWSIYHSAQWNFPIVYTKLKENRRDSHILSESSQIQLLLCYGAMIFHF